MMLADLQRGMRDWLHTGSSHIAARFGESAASGLGIYQNNYRAQLAGLLEDSFARTREWIGEEAFHEVVVHHVDRVPPSSWTLDAYGRDFPETLALLYPQDPEIAELAGLELGLADAFVGADAVPVLAHEIAGIDWDHAVLSFVPTLALRPLMTNAPAIWTALAQDSEPPAAERLPEPQGLLIWRQDETPRFRVIDAREHRMLDMALKGMWFAALCNHLAGEIGEEAAIAFAGHCLGTWIKDGLLASRQRMVNAPSQLDQKWVASDSSTLRGAPM